MNNLTQTLKLNRYEYELLTELIKSKRLNVHQIFMSTTIPRNRIYDIAETLSNRGFCKIKDKEKVEIITNNRFNKKRTRYKTNPKSFEIESLEQIKDNIKKTMEKEIKNKLKALDVLYRGDENDK